MPTNTRFHSVHQTSSVPAQENRDRAMPKIINCTTVGHRNQPRGYIISNGLENSAQPLEQSGYVASAYELGQVDAELVSEVRVRPSQQHRPIHRGSYVVSSSSPVIQEVFSRPAGTRSREVHARTQSHGNRSAEPSYPRSSPNSAFVPFGTHNSQQGRRHYPSYQEIRTVRGSGNQANNQQYVVHQPLSDQPSRSQFNCPIPLPNHGTVVMNPNQPVMLPPYGNHDNLSGILVIPLKKTCEVSIQTDESCLSPQYAQYRPPQEQSDETRLSSQPETNSSQLKCTVCQQQFQDTQKLRQHFEANHSKESLRCKDCGQVFLTARNMQMHKVRVHNKRMPFRCGVCGVRFEDRTSVVQHLSTHNANEYIFRCDTCGKRFGNEEKLRKHEQKHQDMWHKCIECHKSFGSEVTLAYHIDQVHNRRDRQENEARVTDVNRVVPEDEDGEVHSESNFASGRPREGVSEERVMNTGDNMTCELCNMQFSNSKELENHVKSCGLGKGMKKMFRCAVCQTFFALQSQLVNHYNTMHHSRDGYMCSKCPRKFRLWSRLKLHIKAFHQTKKSSALKNVCSVCSERFMSRNKLEDHLRQVHRIQPFQSKVGRIYTCKECKKRFTNLSSLMVHRRGVHSLNILESPSTQTWKCQYCNIERLTKKTYIAHLKEVHDLLVVEKGRSLEIVGKDSEETVLQQGDLPDNNREYPGGAITNRNMDEKAIGDMSCSHCGANFEDVKRLKNHLGLVHGQKPFSCGTCGKKFAYSGQIACHMREHGKGEVTSKEVGNGSDSMASPNSALAKGSDTTVTVEADSATTVDQGLPPHTCIHCNTTYQNEKRLNNHLGMRHGYKNFECDVCNQRFSYSTHLIWHRRSHFPEKKKDGANKVNAEEDFDTLSESNILREDNEELGSSLDDSKDEESSLKIGGDNGDYSLEHPGSRFVCGQCGADFSGEEEFRDHMIKMHDIDAERVGDKIVAGPGEAQEIGSYFCEICNKQLSTQVGWKVHRTRVHKLTDEKPALKSPASANPVSFPGTRDGNAELVGDVQQSPHPKKNELGSEDLSQSAVYSCTKCSRVFTGLRSLRTHQFKLHAIRVKDTHHRTPQINNDASLFSRIQNVEIFQCGTCDYQFSTEKGRRIHCKKMRHAERRGTFNQSTLPDVERDIVVEPAEVGSPTGSKRQKLNEDANLTDSNDSSSLCEICGAEFPNLNELKLHFQEIHPGEFSFPESAFKHGDVSDSESNVDAVQPVPSPIMIECPRCERSFPSRKAINAHMVKFHKIKGAALVRSLKEGRSDSLNAGSRGGSESQDLSLGSSDTSDYSGTVSKGFRVCPVCQRAFQNRRGLTMHLVRYHHMNKIGIQRVNLGVPLEEDLSSLSPVTKSPTMATARYSTGSKERCPLCPMTFPSKRSLGTHIFKRHGIRCKQLSPAERRSLFSGAMYPRPDGEPTMVNREVLVATDCPICGGKFVGKRGLRAHVSRIHGLDKVELGFMFPDKNATDDDVVTKCDECGRIFNNQRIFAAHLYFVHKRDAVDTLENKAEKSEMGNASSVAEKGNTLPSPTDESTMQGKETSDKDGENDDKDQQINTAVEEASSVNLQLDQNKYVCSDASCNRAFRTPLELLVHVREKNGRSLSDIDKELKNTISSEAVDEQEESFDYDYVDEDELDGEEDELFSGGDQAIDAGM